jgi:hypothetical protein
MEGGASVRIDERGARRHLCRGLGLQIRIQSLTPIHSDSAGGQRRQFADSAGLAMGAAAPRAAVPGIRISACRRLGACTFSILAREFGRNMSFDARFAHGAAWHADTQFQIVRAAADECADSRVRLGFHFRYSTDAGQKVGWRTANHAMERYLKRARESGIQLRAQQNAYEDRRHERIPELYLAPRHVFRGFWDDGARSCGAAWRHPESPATRSGLMTDL